MTTELCICEPLYCAGEGFERDDPRTCLHCASLDGEMPCPADPSTYDSTIESLMDAVSDVEDFAPVVVCADGSEPFASLDLGHGLVLDLTAQLRRTPLPAVAAS